jgi:hypothetical protein
MERNRAGDLVGPEECLRRDGSPKKIYTYAEAVAWRKEHGDGRYEPYVCTKGHWHIGSKLQRPIVTYD